MINTTTTTTTTTDTATITIRARAFRGEGVRAHRCLVGPDGAVRVWDPVAGHYTTCHSLGRSAEGRARRMAAQAARTAAGAEDLS